MKSPVTAFSQVPPWPPQEAPSGDDDHNIAVLFYQHRKTSEGIELTERLALATFDPLHSDSQRVVLALHGLPDLKGNAFYSVESGAVTVMLRQSERDLLTVSSPGPTDSYSTFRLSHDIALSILIHRRSKK
jgi:hypothetical protein